MNTYPTIRGMLRTLAEADPDRAGERNAVGFKANHTAPGHRLNGYRVWRADMAFDAYQLIKDYRNTQLQAADWDTADEEAMDALSLIRLREREDDMEDQSEQMAHTSAAIMAEPAGETDQDYSADLDAPAPAIPARYVLGPAGPIAQALPGYETREAQLQVADRVEAAFTFRRHLVGEAGTGVGKSLAYLVPAILSGKRTIVSTGDKSLQEQISKKDVPFLQQYGGQRFDAAVLKGRGNYVCKYALRPFVAAGGGVEQSAMFDAPGDAAIIGEIIAWERRTVDGDIDALPLLIPAAVRAKVTVSSEDCIGQSCPDYRACWGEKAKARAKAARILIVNHALLMQDARLRASSNGGMAILGDAEYIVLDEAHHLEDAAAGAFGDELVLSTFGRLTNRLEQMTTQHAEVRAAGELGELYATAKAFTDLADTAYTALGGFERTITARAEREPIVRLGDERGITGPFTQAMIRLSVKMGGEIPAWLPAEADRAKWEKLRERLDDFARIVEAAATPTDPRERVRFAEVEVEGRRRAQTTLKIVPIDVSDILRNALFETSFVKPKVAAAGTDTGDDDGAEADDIATVPVTVISLSATLATAGGFDYWRSRVGLDSALEILVGSPFDYRRNALLYLPARGADFDPTNARGDNSLAYTERLTEEIGRLLLASDGRAFVLFTSNAMLNEVHRRLAPRLRWTVLKQGDAPRPELIRQFKDDGNAVLFGVKSFWEGVDVQGSALSLVIIDKLPFNPPTDPVWNGKCDAIGAATGDRWAWFNKLAIPEATIALKQGFGRLIRGKEDRGVVAILDGRMTTKGYGRTIIGSLPPATVTHSIEAVRAFYGG